MISINERLMFLIEELGYNKNSFSKAIGHTSNVVVQSIVGKRGTKPSSDVLSRLMRKFPEVNADWLLTGKGVPFKVNIKRVDIDEFREKFDDFYRDKFQWDPEKQKEIEKILHENEVLRAQLEVMKSQFDDKNKVIAAQQKVIEVLEAKK